MRKKPLIIANWKMNVDQHGLESFFAHWDLEPGELERVKVVICPSFIFFTEMKSLIGDRPIYLGGQNIFWEKSGAFTGEVSARQLAEADCRYVIVGHSERRRLFHEDDAMVNKKILLALQSGLQPIVCLGESYEEKEAGLTKKVVEEKIRNCLHDIPLLELKKVVVVYEPVWAISTDPHNPGHLADSPEEAQVVHKFIRKVIAGLTNANLAESLVLVYGGSINPDNVNGFAAMDDIDGVLVGSASTEAGKFEKIIRAYL